jgi:NADH-quinone oxidoreductase subunit L
MALAATDIKKVLAYSTVSQLGYMFLACGVGAFAAGIFHLVTHAFFKALLFLGAGSVMHALSGETNIFKMGDLKKHLPVTHATFLIAGLAIAGIPGLSGFFSKDEILWKTFSSEYGSVVLYVMALATAGLTAFYMFRMIFLTFYGTSRVAPEVMNHVHESPKVMTVPLVVLAVLSVIGGWIGVPHAFNQIEHFLEPVFTRYRPVEAQVHGSMSTELLLMALSVAVALAGIFVARRIYLQNPAIADRLRERFRALYRLLSRKYYVDEIYDALFVRPIHRFSESFLWKIFDVKGIDGFVNFVPTIFDKAAGSLRRWQSGVVQNYAVSIMVGLILVLGYLLMR